MAAVKRILVVDDHTAVRVAVRRLLECMPDLEVCGEAENGRVGIEKALQLKPDLVVLDLSMPVMNGLEAAKTLRALMPGMPILMFTSFSNANLAEEALAAGVSEVALKAGPPEALLGALRTLLRNPA